MLTCGKEIDSKPLSEGDSAKEAVKVAIAHMGYSILAATYQQEALNRALWFIDNKHLTKEFVANDSQRVTKPAP